MSCSILFEISPSFRAIFRRVGATIRQVKANQKLKEANVRTTEVSKKIHVTKWNIRQLSDCKIKQPVREGTFFLGGGGLGNFGIFFPKKVLAFPCVLIKKLLTPHL